MIICVHFSSSSCYVAPSANLKVAGRRIARGKYATVGKMCLAPSYVLCLKAAVKEYYREVCVSVCECVLHIHVCVHACVCVYLFVYTCPVCIQGHLCVSSCMIRTENCLKIPV